MTSENKTRTLILCCILIISGMFNESIAQKSKRGKAKKATTESIAPKEQPVQQKLQATTQVAVVEEKTKDLPTIELVDENTLLLGDQKYNYEPLTFNTTNGQIDYSNQVIKATGMSVIDSDRFKNPAQARAMAIQGARADAQRKLLETVQGVQVIAETSVRDMITESDVVNTRVQGLLRGAAMVGEPVVKDGLIEVTMQIGMYGESSLANAVYDELIEKDYRAKKSQKIMTDEPATMVPGSVVQEEVEDVEESPSTQDNKQLVFNLNGQRIDPSLFPVVVDESGKILLDMTKIYNPKNGKFPKYLQMGKELMTDVGLNKQVEMINVLEATGGKITVDTRKSKINWARIGSTLGKIGKFLLLLL